MKPRYPLLPLLTIFPVLASCGSSPAPTPPAESTLQISPDSKTKAPLSAQWAGSGCLSAMPADAYAVSVFSTCSTNPAEPSVLYDYLQADMRVCDPYGDLPAALPVNWVITDKMTFTTSCQWSGGNQIYNEYVVSQVDGKQSMIVCDFTRIPADWSWGAPNTFYCNGRGRYISKTGRQAAAVTAASLTGSNGMIESGTATPFARPGIEWATAGTLSIQSVPHTCALQKDGPYLRRQTIPTQSGTGVAPAYVFMNVTLPSISNIFIPRGKGGAAWIYLGAKSYKEVGVAIDAGLMFDAYANAFAVGGQYKVPGRSGPDAFNAKINGSPFRVQTGSNVTLEFYINAQNKPVLVLTSSLPFLLHNGNVTNPVLTEYSGPRTITLTIDTPADSDFRWNPTGSNGKTGQPMKAMVSMALNDLASVDALKSRDEKILQVQVNSFYPGVISGFKADGTPVVRKVAWPKAPSNSSPEYCLTPYVQASGDRDRSLRVDIKLPFAPATGGGGGGGGACPQLAPGRDTERVDNLKQMSRDAIAVC